MSSQDDKARVATSSHAVVDRTSSAPMPSSTSRPNAWSGQSGTASNEPHIPQISKPSGGGSIRSMGDEFKVNMSSGSGSMNISLPITKMARWGSPNVELVYDSGTGNGTFGVGWGLSGLPSISRKTSRRRPTYIGEQDSYIFEGDELLPSFEKRNGEVWPLAKDDAYKVDERLCRGFTVRNYVPRVNHRFERIERWSRNSDSKDVHWRVLTPNNETFIFGRSDESRTCFQGRIFEWHLSEAYDGLGGARLVEWKAEDGKGVDRQLPHEQHRTDAERASCRLIKRIRYGNQMPNRCIGNWSEVIPATDLPESTWLFELIFDYGEHHAAFPTPDSDTEKTWPVREDPFSTYTPGFEIRTYRLCRRVLMFHHFPDQLHESSTLVSSLTLEYDEGKSISYLKKAYTMGHGFDGSVRLSKALPPIEFEYSQPCTEDMLQKLSSKPFSAQSFNDLNPSAMDHLNWIDFLGDGTSGLVVQDNGSWYCKRNLSARKHGASENSDTESTDSGSEVILSSIQSLPVQPGFPADLDQNFHVTMVDIDGNGLIDVMVWDENMQGFYAGHQDMGKHMSWKTFQPFNSWPNIDMNDPNLRMIDLTGDGIPDILITHEDRLIVHYSLGYQGFGPSHELTQLLGERCSPCLLFSNHDESMHLSDMSGDGNVDIVRVRNGEVCYWPNLGYGEFGDKVIMDNSPVFSGYGTFNHRDIIMFDLDGSGTSDILHRTQKGLVLYFNQAGNSWGSPVLLASLFPEFDTLTHLSAVDLFGTGTACLVWASATRGSSGRFSDAMRYVDLMGGVKPHLLRKSKNNMGLETTMTYRSSVSFYLADEAKGTPWVTCPPFPVQCIETVTVYDHINQSVEVERFGYKHGYYDRHEREFRGFGMVEYWNTQSFESLGKITPPNLANVDRATYVAPIYTKTWFHQGAPDEMEKIQRLYSKEFTEKVVGVGRDTSKTPWFDIEPTVLSADDYREACASLKGTELLQEQYRLDVGCETPFSITETRSRVRLVQPRGSNLHASFQKFEYESISKSCEKDPRDFSMSQTLLLDVDDYGNVLKCAQISYGRPKEILSGLDAKDAARQQTTHVVYTCNTFTLPVSGNDVYCAPKSCATDSFDIVGLKPVADRFDVKDFAGRGDFSPVTSLKTIRYHGLADSTPSKRLISSNRTLYKSNDLESLLPLRHTGTHSLLGCQYQLCLTQDMLEVFKKGGDLVADPANMLKLAGYSHFLDDNAWWIPSGTVRYCNGEADQLLEAQRSFFLPKELLNPCGGISKVLYDAHSLLPIQTCDAMGNTTQASYDYRQLSITQIVDCNQNTTKLAWDVFGRLVGTAIVGKSSGRMDSFDGFQVHPSEEAIQKFKRDPIKYGGQLLAKASARHIYDDFAFIKHALPIMASTINATKFGPRSDSENNISLSYHDSSGHAIQQKVPADNDKWLTSGWKVYNNKGLVVQEFDPFFDDSPAFSSNVRQGKSSIMLYDARDRVIATIFPDHTWTKTVHDTWSVTAYDQNDLVDRDPSSDPDISYAIKHLPKDSYLPTWYSVRSKGEQGMMEKVAAEKSFRHRSTPDVAHYDALGHVFLSSRETGSARVTTKRYLDIQGHEITAIDGEGRIATRNTYDMAGRVLFYENLDHAPRWSLTSIDNMPVFSWSAHGRRLRYEYDELRRNNALYLVEQGKDEICTLRTVYGDSMEACQDNPSVAKQNLRQQVYKSYDQSGVRTFVQYDITGNCTATKLQLSSVYKDNVDWKNAPLLEDALYLTEMCFDALGRKTSTRTHDKSTTRFSYGVNGLLSSVQVHLSEKEMPETFTSISYDEYSREIERRQTDDNIVIKHIYDTITKRLREKIVLRKDTVIKHIFHSYDAGGHLICEEDRANKAMRFRERVVPCNVEFTYDSAYRLIEASGREHLGQTKGRPFTSGKLDKSKSLGNGLSANDETAVARYVESYQYDRAGNMLQIAHRIMDSQNPGWTRHFGYQSSSYIEKGVRNNRLTFSRVGDVDNPVDNYTYDDNGNILSMPGLSAEWDYTNHLKSTTADKTQNPRAKTWYVYGQSGARVRKVVDCSHPDTNDSTKSKERIFLDNFEIFTKNDGQGQCHLRCDTLHVNIGALGSAMVERWSGSSREKKKIPSMISRFSYDSSNELARTEFDENGTLLSHAEYTPFGCSTFSTKTTKIPKRYGYSGKQRDGETGFYYFEQRYYAPWMCRWLSPDPLGTADTLNVFEYVRNNPIELTDPNGTFPQDRLLAPKKKIIQKKRGRPKNKKKMPADIKKAKTLVQEIRSDSDKRDQFYKLKMGIPGRLSQTDIDRAQETTSKSIASYMGQQCVWNKSHTVPDCHGDYVTKILDVDTSILLLPQIVNMGHMTKDFDIAWRQHMKQKHTVKLGNGPQTITTAQWYYIKGKLGEKVHARAVLNANARNIYERFGYGSWKIDKRGFLTAEQVKMDNNNPALEPVKKKMMKPEWVSVIEQEKQSEIQALQKRMEALEARNQELERWYAAFQNGSK